MKFKKHKWENLSFLLEIIPLIVLTVVVEWTLFADESM